MARDSGRELGRAFGQVVRDRRLRAKLSQEALAERAELTRNYVSDLERGLKSPTLASVEALANALGSQPSLLIRAAERRLS
ncbi:MAG: helix-turn-helix domain-containing protein [Actinomycetota bacterium]